ncbi:MAG: anti-sigma factor [Pseudomonadota bacterium]
MKIWKHPILMERLAAEYVLGTLKGGARRRFEFWLQQDISLQAVVQRWQAHLQPMLELPVAVRPPQRVWESIAKETGLRAPAAKSTFRPLQALYKSLHFWRGLGIASTALTIFLGLGLLREEPNTALPATPQALGASNLASLAVLADERLQPVALVTGKPDSNRITVQMIAPHMIGQNKSLELWAVPSTGKPKSLGLLAVGGTVELLLPETITPTNTPLLAATLEPAGGSPDPNGATGPIVFKGSWIRL